MAAEMWLIMPTGTCTSWADTTEQEQISIIWLSLSWVWFQGEIKFSLSHPIVFSKTWESEITQSCPNLCNPMDCSLPRFSVHGIFQARIPEWVAISFSRGSSQPRDRTQVSCIVGRSFTVWATREVINLQSLVTTHTHTHTHTLQNRDLANEILAHWCTASSSSAPSLQSRKLSWESDQETGVFTCSSPVMGTLGTKCLGEKERCFQMNLPEAQAHGSRSEHREPHPLVSALHAKPPCFWISFL